MSRSGYDDDGGEFLALYRGAVDSAMFGKRGQKLLRELADAMDAMEIKELIADELQANGQFCALGVVGKVRGIDMTKLHPECPDQIGKAFNIAESMAREISYINDDDFRYHRETDAQRWTRVRAWVDDNIIKDES